MLVTRTLLVVPLSVWCLLLCLLASLSAGEAPRNRAYPAEAFLVPLSEKGKLQQYLDMYGAVRLEPGGDYLAGGIQTLRIRSGYRLYGLSNNIPDTIIEPGTTGAVLSYIHGKITFPPSSEVTKNNLFRRTTYCNIVINGASLEENLFLDVAFCVINADHSTSGFMRNNRFIRFQSHGGNPMLTIRGDPQQRSSGNVFLWVNLLGPPDKVTYFDNLPDLTLLHVDCESYSTAGQPSIHTGPMGHLTVFGSTGALQTGRTIDTQAKSLWLHGHSLSTAVKPSVVLGKDTSALLVHNPDVMEVKRDGSKTVRLFNDTMNKNTVEVDGTVVAVEQSGEGLLGALKNCLPATKSVAWEVPAFAPPPDPAGAKWDVGLDKKKSQREELQKLLDTVKHVVLPPGTYYLDGPLKLGKGQSLVGSGMDKTVLISLDKEKDLIMDDGTGRMILTDLTLQGGRYGIYHTWTTGPNLQVVDLCISHVTIRSMSKAGLCFEHIYGWDNNFVDFVNFVDCPIGIRQLATNFGTAENQSLTYMDKCVFYQCQFIRCGKALDLQARRASGGNLWVNCLFQDSTECAATMINHSPATFANCDFIGNAGAPVIGTNGHLFVIGCRFTADTAKAIDLIDGFSVSAEGCTFDPGSSGSTVVTSFTPGWIDISIDFNKQMMAKRGFFFYNCTSRMPVGDAFQNGLVYNSIFTKEPVLSRKAVMVSGGKPMVLLNTPSEPVERLLVGSILPYPLVSEFTPSASSKPEKRKKK
jgi:hypothetical protein